MKKTLLLLLFLLPFWTLAQETAQPDYKKIFNNPYPLSSLDSTYFNTLPVLELPESLRGKVLPASHDNSSNQYFRPIFSQENYPNCMQSSSIAYAFTYEVDRLRELPANLPENQYTTHFSWNFFNNGWHGVNYLHTHEVLRMSGTPNLVDYDGFYTGGGERWMSGYEKYYHAMQNRLEGAYTIPVDNEEGLLILKNWLHNHLEGSHVGGLANFIACSPWNYTTLPDGTPEAGRKVMVSFCPEAVHGMTIVGWNDSICFDYNGDTRYTNDEDINGDGVVDMQDWEIGGLKFANSYGDQWADSGFCYMMYRTLAAPISEGGIWGNLVHVLMPKEDYHPLMTMKVRLKHNARKMIRVRAGVSPDPEIGYPTHILEFPIFRFQGKHMPMQGCDSSEICKVIEFGLDITPLLSHVESGHTASYFLQVYEQDPQAEGTGEILDFSLIDYSNGLQEYAYPSDNIPLVHNGKTELVIPAAVSFNAPEITTTLPPLQQGVPVQLQMEASGGTGPYTWHLRHKYGQSMKQAVFPTVSTNQLMPNDQNDSIFAIPLDFTFPFFGEQYDTVRVNALGYVFFGDPIIHWPYMKQEAYYFKHIKAISPLKSKDLIHYPFLGDGLWYESSEDYVLFRWKVSVRDQDGTSDINFALKLEQDGKVSMYFGDIQYQDIIEWAGGLSFGNNIDHHILDIPDPRTIKPGALAEFIYNPAPAEISISRDGLLHILPDDLSTLYNIQITAIDRDNMCAYRTYQLSDIISTEYVFNAGGDTNITPGVEVLMDYTVKNIGQQILQNVQASISCDDSYITLSDATENFGSLGPGESKTIEGAFRFTTSSEIPDAYSVVFENFIHTDLGQKEMKILARAKASRLGFAGVQVDDGNNGRLDPDESASLVIRINNAGHTDALDVEAELVPLNEFISLEGSANLNYGQIKPGRSETRAYDIFASPMTLNGYEAPFLLKITESSGQVVYDTLEIMVGKKPVLIIDLAPLHDSGPGMFGALEELEIYSDYTRTFPYSISNYQSVFICLGMQTSYYTLTMEEGSKLADFLDNGGKIYLEGRRTWRDDPTTPVHSMFNIDINNIPVMYNIVQGIDSTFTEGMAFHNLSTPPFSYYSLVPVPPAFDILQNREDSLSCAVAYDAGHYQTIGSVIEFGNLLDDTSHKVDLMEQILLFFDIRLSTIGVDEPVSPGNMVSAYNYPNPFSGKTDISFTLAKNSEVSLGVYNLNGQLIQNLASDKMYGKGRHIIPFNPGKLGLPGGIYIYRLLSDQQVLSGKMILLD